MSPNMPGPGGMRVVVLALCALLIPLLAIAGDPEVTITRLENLPNRLIYFDDTPVRLTGYSKPEIDSC